MSAGRTPRIEALWRGLAREQEQLRTAGADARNAAARARFLAAVDQRRSRRWWWIGLPVCALAAATVLLAWLLPSSVLTFEVGPERRPGVVGAWLAAPPKRDEPLVFSDGSRVSLRPGSRARVAQVRTDGVHLVLETGEARVMVQRRPRPTWRIDAGPYRVEVTGTRFIVRWDPALELFELALEEGAVVVRGPRLEAATAVEAGERLRLGGDERRARGRAAVSARAERPAATDATPEPAGAAHPDPIRPEPLPQKRPRASPTQATPDDGTTGPPPGWQELADRASYREALAAAQAQDYDALCETLPSPELLRLADVARFARRPEPARQALSAARRRFPGTDAAAMAAFERGRIAFTSGDAYAEAARWFATYLRERPKGAVAREALGRLMRAQLKAGKPDAARRSAGAYLERFPNGPHADLAVRVAGGHP